MFAAIIESTTASGGSSVGAWGTAAIATGGAIVGGVLTAGSNLLVERSRRKHDEKARRDADTREVRQAVRLVLDELSEIDDAITRAVKSHLTWPQDRQLPAFAWNEYKAVLAAHVPDEAWRWATAAYDAADELNWRVIELQREFRTEGQVHFIETDWLREPFRSIRHAMTAVENVLGPKAGIYAYTGYVSVEEMEAELWPDSRGSDETSASD